MLKEILHREEKWWRSETYKERKGTGEGEKWK